MADATPQEPFFHHQEVRFGDVDPGGVLYYPVFLHYFHIAMEEFMGDRVGTPYAEMLRRDRVGFPTVRLETDFRAPVRYGETVDIAVGVARIGTTSVVFAFDASVDDRPVARARITTVAVDLDAWKPIDVPAEMRAVFERHLVVGESP